MLKYIDEPVTFAMQHGRQDRTFNGKSGKSDEKSSYS